MHFIEFIRTLPRQDDKPGDRFIQWAKEQKDFPLSSDPRILAEYLYDKLDWDLTLAYQKLFFLYDYLTAGNPIPKK